MQQLPSLPAWSSLIDSVGGTPVVHWGSCWSPSIKAQLFPSVLQATKHSCSPLICLIYWVFYLRENLHVPSVGDMDIYIIFMRTLVYVAFSWIFAFWRDFFFLFCFVLFFLFWFHPFAPNPTTWYGSHCSISLPPQCIRPSNICRHLSLPPLCLVISLPS